MVNKFKDFVAKWRSKLTTQWAAYRQRSNATSDKTGEFNLPAQLSEEQPALPPDLSHPRLKLPTLNRLSPYTHKIKVLLTPLAFKAQVLARNLWTQLSRSGVGKKLNQTDWGALADKLLSRDWYSHHHRIFVVTFLVVTTYSVGKITALIIKGRPQFPAIVTSGPSEMSQAFNPSSLNQIKLSDPFKTKSAPKDTGKLADTICEEASERTSLPIKLVNSIVLQDSVKSIAAVQVRSGRDLKQVREGDTLDDMARISRIARLELIIKNLQTGACESVPNERMRETRAPISVMTPTEATQFKQQQKIKGIENVGNRYTISKDLLDEKLKDIASVLSEARAIKIQNPDGTLAFKITEIEAGGIFSYLGIQNEDIITSINGKPITDLNEVMSLFGRIKNLDQLQLGIRRDGEETQMDYQIKK